jgi:hypothetical protein
VVRLIDQFDTDEAARSCSLSHVLRPLTAPATSARSSRRAAAFRPEDTGALLHHSCICKLNREAQLPVNSPSTRAAGCTGSAPVRVCPTPDDGVGNGSGGAVDGNTEFVRLFRPRPGSAPDTPSVPTTRRQLHLTGGGDGALRVHGPARSARMIAEVIC